MTAPARPLVVTAVWKEPPSNPVIREQVLLRAATWRELGFDSRVAIGLDASPRDMELLRENLVPWALFPAGGMSELVRFVGRVMRGSRPEGAATPILVCRGALVAAAALLAREQASVPWLIVHDARGWYTAESETKREGAARRHAKQAVETTAFRASDHSVVVSETLLGVALAYGADPARTTVLPQYAHPFPPVQGALPPEPDVLYVGNSVHGYQTVELVAPLLRGLAQRMPSVTFGWLDVALPPDTSESLEPNLWRRSVRPDAVGPYIERAKAALLIREVSGDTAASAPTKAFQYMAAGTAVVTTPHPASVAQICRQDGRGRVVSSMNVEEWAAALSDVLSRPSSGPFDAYQHATQAWQELFESLLAGR
jgi:Glycosyl transferase 4-like domain/Glycosyl transferases group 1